MICFLPYFGDCQGMDIQARYSEGSVDSYAVAVSFLVHSFEGHSNLCLAGMVQEVGFASRCPEMDVDGVVAAFDF